MARWDLAWERARAGMPDGSVSLWLAALSDGGELLGAGPVTSPEGWHWARGALAYRYGEVRMDIVAEGRTERGMIVAVSREAGCYAPLFSFAMSRQEVLPGMTLTVLDGAIALLAPSEEDR